MFISSRNALCTALVVCVCLAFHDAGRAQTLQNGYMSLNKSGNAITSLRFDASGSGAYGMETVTGAGIRNVTTATLSANILTITGGNTFMWDLPFLKDGYYDADTHLNYPHDTDTAGASALTLPFRCFVGSSGHTTRIEHFKRLPTGNYFLTLNIQDGSRLLMQSDRAQNWDIETLWTGATYLSYNPQSDRLTFTGTNMTGPLEITVLPAGARDVPVNAFTMPKAVFTPDTEITFDPTGKTLPISRLMTEFMRNGIYFWPSTPPGGEWVIGTEMHLLDDPRSWYIKKLRQDFLNEQAWMGYDRFEHFGCQYAWGRYPDYGAGGLLNVPPGNAPYDLRHLHINGARIQAIARYIMAAGGKDILLSRRARWVSTNGAQSQPVCGNGADFLDYVLASGDVRMDAKAPTKRHSLGQEFTATAPFATVKALLGNPSTTEANHGKLTLYNGYGGAQITQTAFSIPANTTQQIALTALSTQPTGKYYLEVTDDDSWSRYFGPGVVWWTKIDANYAGGDAYNGPHHGGLDADLKALFDYMRNYMGAAATGMIYYQTTPEYNVPNQRSGRNAVCMPNSYYEGAGGGYDAYAGLWYNDACYALAELHKLLGDTARETQYRDMWNFANAKYQAKYWHTVVEGGAAYDRFHGCQDWDGAIHDFGFTHNNLEAASRGMVSPDIARAILWWLDRGKWSGNGGTTWSNDIYSIWEAVPPWNTRANSTWYNVTGTLPYLQVLTNGGARLDTAARDLFTRSQYLSVDNMHERNERILARYANPDRLTGGRTYNDPGGRGRWFFLGPNSNIADFEGFREIFPGNGTVAAYQPVSYLGIKLTGGGMQLRPRVPSNYTSFLFENIGYWQSLFSFSAAALRDQVMGPTPGPSTCNAPSTGSIGQTFVAPAPFSKVGLQVAVMPYLNRKNNQLSMTLERETSGTWSKIAETWFNHARTGQWVWISAPQAMPEGQNYRVKINKVSAAAGETIALRYSPAETITSGSAFLADGASGTITGDLAFQLVNERTSLTADCTYNPSAIRFEIVGARAGSNVVDHGGGIVTITTVLDADESAFLRAKSGSAANTEWPAYR